MITMTACAGFSLATAVWANAPAGEADVRKLFAQGGQAYDAGQYAEAVRHFTTIEKMGWMAPELLFNLGNACLKQGDLGRAVLHYRRAWMLWPRDQDLQANLRFALQSNQALAPVDPLPVALLFKLSLAEWTGLAVTSYWLAAAALAAYWLSRVRRGWLLKLAGTLGVILVISCAGILQWLRYRDGREWVVVAPNQQALFAPLDKSTPHFALPPGSIIRLQDVSGPWIRVTSGKESGWVHRDACQPVYPWQGAGSP